MENQNKYSFILLEDKQIFGLNKVHKNVLKPTLDLYTNVKPKVYYDPSNTTETDDMFIDENMLSFVTDGLDFNKEVIQTKAAYSIPYNAKETKELFRNKNHISSDYNIKKKELKYGQISSAVQKRIKQQRKISQKRIKLALIVNETSNGDFEIVGDALIKFKTKNLFSRSNENLTSLNQINEKLKSKSLDDLNELNEQVNLEQNEQDEVEITPVFLTETTLLDDYKKVLKERDLINESNDNNKKRSQSAINKLKSLNEVKWDDHLIDQLSENTARWIVMKNTFDPKQKKKLNEMVDKKYGKFTRDIQDLELIEYGLTDYEKRKIAEEKQRIKNETKKQTEKVVDIKEEQLKSKTPVYRLPVGLKRDALVKLKIPDNSFNKTAQNLVVQPAIIDPPKTYRDKMLDLTRVTTKTVFNSENPLTNRLLEGGLTYKFKRDENKIKLDDDTEFKKCLQPVFPIEFTQWISGVELVKNVKNKKPVKGKRRWTKLPELIDKNDMKNPYEIDSKLDNYWNLMPTTTDTQLRKIAKSNLTVAKIVDEWRKKWQTSSKWTMAEIEELITDMKDPQANIRFQAVVVCSRAVEQIQILISKFKKYHEKYPPKMIDTDDEDDDNDIKDKSLNTFSTETTKTDKTTSNQLRKKHKKNFISFNYEDTENLIYSANLFETIESLLNDTNDKVKLAAAIAIFILLRYFKRPMLQKVQESKNKAENLLREILNGYNNADKYTASQCLAIDGYCEDKIIRVLLKSYFDSTEQFTKEQVTKTLSHLSADNELVSKLIEEFLSSDHSRERILSAKLIPCLRRSISKEATQKLIDLMWNDMNINVKKVAAQTLGRTGRGREVHNEILNRLNSLNVFDRIEALKKINFIGIMTNKMLNSFLKCFRDDHISVRELACKSSQCLWDKPDKLVDSILFMAKYDQVNKLKALAIQTLGLVGEFNNEIRRCLLWALQFELDPLVRTEACHSLILLTKNIKYDEEIIDILQERHLIEEVPIVRNELMSTLIHMGFNPNRELPIVTKIKSDVAKFNDKQTIINKIKQIEKQLMFEFDKKRFLWQQQQQQQKHKQEPTQNLIQQVINEDNETDQSKKTTTTTIETNKKPQTKSMIKFQQKLTRIKQSAQISDVKSTNNSSFLAKLVE